MIIKQLPVLCLIGFHRWTVMERMYRSPAARGRRAATYYCERCGKKEET